MKVLPSQRPCASGRDLIPSADEEKEAKIKDLHSKLSSLMLRRLKKDVVQSLPTKTEKILRVEMSEMQMKWYKLVLAKVRAPGSSHMSEA